MQSRLSFSVPFSVPFSGLFLGRFLSLVFWFGSFVAFAGPTAAQARPVEPAAVDPVKDAAYLSTLGLSSSDWDDNVVNILVVGQDGQTDYHKKLKYTRPNGEQVPALSSHADGNMLLSFNKRNGTVAILSLYRGFLVHDDKWVDVQDAPEIPKHTALTTRYVANYYLYAGRAKYLTFVRDVFENFVRSQRLERSFLTNNRLKIHGLVETDFGGFKAAMGQFIDYFGSSAYIALKLSSQAGRLLGLLVNRSAIMAELRSQPAFQVMTKKRQLELSKEPERAILGILRERQNYDGGGYQRAFNHAKFISYVLGLTGYIMAEKNFPDFLSEIAIQKAFGTFSRSFELSTFDQKLRMADRNLHMIARTGFNDGHSPMYIVQIGTSLATYSVYNNGRFGVTEAEGFASKIDPLVEVIPKPDDCPACRAR